MIDLDVHRFSARTATKLGQNSGLVHVSCGSLRCSPTRQGRFHDVHRWARLTSRKTSSLAFGFSAHIHDWRQTCVLGVAFFHACKKTFFFFDFFKSRPRNCIPVCSSRLRVAVHLRLPSSCLLFPEAPSLREQPSLLFVKV